MTQVSTVVSVMDREGWDANTDIIVLADERRRTLLWIPRDVWCPRLGDRVNAAFGRGGHEALADALAELGLRPDHGVCLARSATARALRDVRVEVPVGRPLAFRYPLAPEEPIEDGERVVRFDPPAETLTGERVHQWIGARFEVGRPSSDLDRIARQQALVAALLRRRLGVGRAIAGVDGVSVSGPGALGELGAVDASWRLRTLGRLRPATIAGRAVLVRDPWWRPSVRGALFRAGWPGVRRALR
jgi:LytR_cpsA_psr family